MTDSESTRQLARDLFNMEQALLTLHEVTRAILVAHEPLRLYRSVFSALRQVMPIDAGFIHYYHRDHDRLQMVYAIDEDVEESSDDLDDYRQSSLMNWIVTQREALLFADLHVDRQQRFPTSVMTPFGDNRKRSRAWMSVPLLIGTTLIGVLNVQSYQPGIYGVFEQQLLETLADTVAVAMENIQLLRNLDESINELDVPLIPLADDVLIVPLLGVLDPNHWETLTENVLTTIAQGYDQVLLDASGITAFDLQTVQSLMVLVRAIDLVGARSVVIGMRPPLIEGLVASGFNVWNLRTTRDLEGALRLINATG